MGLLLLLIAVTDWLSKLPFLNEAKLRKWDLPKLRLYPIQNIICDPIERCSLYLHSQSTYVLYDFNDYLQTITIDYFHFNSGLLYLQFDYVHGPFFFS
jgi:hypothetical protein